MNLVNRKCIHREHGIGRIVEHDLAAATVTIITRLGRFTVSAYEVELYGEAKDIEHTQLKPRPK
jgi:hypothetical protein